MPRNEDGTPWASDTARLAFREMRADAIVALRTRDERLSQGRLNAANRYSPVMEVKKDNEQGSTFVPNAALVSIRHSGEDLAVLTRSRWAAFCLKAQDETPYTKCILDRDRNNRLVRMEAAGQAVEDSLKAVAETEMPVMPPTPKPQKKEPALVG